MGHNTYKYVMIKLIAKKAKFKSVRELKANTFIDM